DRAHRDLQLHTVLANGGTFGLNSIPDQVQLLPEKLGRPIAAINGDFYNNHSQYKGDPKGLQIMRGEVVSAPNDWTCIWVAGDGDLRMGKVESKFSVTWPNGATTRLGLN